MNCQILFTGKNKKNIISLSSIEFAQRVVKSNQRVVLQGFIHFSLKLALDSLLSKQRQSSR